VTHPKNQKELLLSGGHSEEMMQWKRHKKERKKERKKGEEQCLGGYLIQHQNPHWTFGLGIYIYICIYPTKVKIWSLCSQLLQGAS